MAEVVVSAATKALLGKLISFTSDEISLVWGVKDGMQKLQTTLRNIQAVLMDAEKQQVEQETVKFWLENLKDVVYEAEEILDEFAYEALRSKLEVQGRICNKLKNFFSISNHVVFRRKMAHKMKDLNQRLDQVSRDKDAFSFNVTGRTNTNVINKETHSHIVDDSVIIGRENDKSKIIALFKDSSIDQQVYRIVLIVGMGGVGKTTLAQIVYGDDALKQQFEKRVWVCVSDNSNQKHVFHQLLESINGKKNKHSSLDVIVNTLKNHLQKERYLIVLDDMWNDKHNEWDAMLNTLLSISSQGSKVVITTRSNEVASMTSGSLYRYTLSRLGADDCWTMLEKIAFGPTGVGKTTNLIKIGKKIARKCGGVPLATKVLGSLMCSKRDEHEWLSIEKSEIWDLQEGEDKIVKVLKLSYDHLESHLKQCFTYCSLFPKDYNMKRKHVIRLWMAEGFLGSSRPNIEMENVGDEYFNRLLSNSFLEEAKIYDGFEIQKTCYKMHDLVHDLAKSVAKMECSIKSVNKIQEEEFSSLRRLNLVSENEFAPFPHSLSKIKKLRTLISTKPWFINNAYGMQVCKNFKYVRVLDLSCSKISELPLSIGKLKHLRYLNLSYSRINELPKSFTTLYNLQTLILKCCFELKDLPRDMGKLINLRNLIFSKSPYNGWLPTLPRQVSSLSSLRCLPIFVVGNKTDGFGIQELRDLNLLGGKLQILNLENISDKTDAMTGGINEKQFILNLQLHWREGGDDFEVLEGLQPHQNLKRLGIHKYAGSGFPTWMTSPDDTLPNLVHVVLENCKKCEYLPPLGLLPFLKVLKIEGFEAVKSIGSEFYGGSNNNNNNNNNNSNNSDVPSFPSLEELSIGAMYHLVDWSDHASSPSCSTSSISSFPRLKRLRIIGCRNLRSMPTRFPSLNALKYWDSNGEPIRSLVESNLSSLSDIHILHCKELVFLPCALFRGNNILARLEICGCEKFEGFIPNQDLEEKHEEKEFQNQLVIPNTSLGVLILNECPAFNDCLQLWGFNSLRVLDLFGCNKSLKCIPSGIQHLPKLDILRIGPLSEELSSFPFPSATVDEQGTVIGDFFPSLGTLTIAGWSKLQSLPEDLQYITSLRDLSIREFESLETLPEWVGNYASLRLLEVRDCKNLKYLPSHKQMQRLTSLQRLHIDDCLVLMYRCKGGGEEAYKISHIPKIDYSRSYHR